MFFKFLCLFFASAVLAAHLKVTPEELQEFFERVDTQVKGLQHETMIQIRTNLIPLEMYIQEAKTGIFLNLTDAAKPYWSTIASLKEAAEQTGLDISECIDLGNNQFYVLNNTIVIPALHAYNYYNQSGNEIISYSATSAYSVIQELIALQQVVPLCKDDTCATELQQTVTQYYQRAKNTLIDAETKPRNYVFVYLPILLEQYNLDIDLYMANYTVFLNEVTDCINKL